MADFRIWARIENIGPSEFLVIASAVPETSGAESASILTTTMQSLADANRERERLVVELGTKVRERGDRVVDVELE